MLRNDAINLPLSPQTTASASEIPYKVVAWIIDRTSEGRCQRIIEVAASSRHERGD